MNHVIKRIIADIKEAKAEVKRLESLRDGILGYERGAKRKGKKQKKASKPK